MRITTVRLPSWMFDALSYLAYEVLDTDRSSVIRMAVQNLICDFKDELPDDLKFKAKVFCRGVESRLHSIEA